MHSILLGNAVLEIGLFTGSFNSDDIFSFPPVFTVVFPIVALAACSISLDHFLYLRSIGIFGSVIIAVALSFLFTHIGY